jgi:hypothetical protein
MNKKMARGIVIMAVGVMMAVASAYGVVTSLTIHANGHVSMVNAYWDAGCTQVVTSIEWGNVYPDMTSNKTVYLKNWGANPVNVSMTTSNWIPSNAETYLTVTWNREHEIIVAGLALEATFTIYVDPSIVGTEIATFSHDITINQKW